jgi:hypothetical protein
VLTFRIALLPNDRTAGRVAAFEQSSIRGFLSPPQTASAVTLHRHRDGSRIIFVFYILSHEHSIATRDLLEPVPRGGSGVALARLSLEYREEEEEESGLYSLNEGVSTYLLHYNLRDIN